MTLLGGRGPMLTQPVDITGAGSGAVNKVGKFTAGDTVGDSSITDDGSSVSTALPVSVGGLTNTSALVESSIITPTALAGGRSDDYAPTGFATARYVFQGVTSSTNISGLAGGVLGRVVTFINTSATSQLLTFLSADSNSAAANRFLLANGTGASAAISGGTGTNLINSITFLYNGSRWVEIARSANIITGTSASFGLLSVAGTSTLVGTTNTTNDDKAAASLVRWSATSDPTATKDTGISRNAAGVLEINNGTAGTLRDLSARSSAFSGATFLTGIISPSALGAADNPDYAPTSFATSRILRLTSGGAASTISGIAGGADGRMITLINIAPNIITTLAESALSAAGNRFTSAVVLAASGAAGSTATFWYDGTTARWRQF